jgi:hypothetical protein
MMASKQELFEKGESRYYIKFPTGKYYVKGIGNQMIETRVIDYAGYYNEKTAAIKAIEELNTEVALIKRKRLPVTSFGEKLDEKMLKNGIELERKYAVGNLGDFRSNKQGGKIVSAYMFSSSHGSKASYLYGVNLLPLDEAKNLATELEKEALEERTKRVVWDVLEIAIIEEEVQI